MRHVKTYPEAEQAPNFPEIEKSILEYWERERIFEASLQKSPRLVDGRSAEFVFYDGPPFANGLPHYGHLATGFVKDLVPRYQTMRGRHVERRFGWDCHGLPAELEVEKEIGVTGRDAILALGIAEFNARCRESVQRYTREWEWYVTRQARWVSFHNAYRTMDLDFMESVMWAFKTLWDKGLIYESYRVVPYSWAAQAPVSNFETRLDNAYRERMDPALTVAFSLVPEPGEPASIKMLAWTTTPWTLPANRAISYARKIDYGVYEIMDAPEGNWLARGEKLILADKLAIDVMRQARVLAYRKLCDAPVDAFSAGECRHPLASFNAGYEFRVPLLEGDHVTDDAGTGFVHTAPGHGREDFDVWMANAAKLAARGIDTTIPYTVDGDGYFTAQAHGFAGKRVLTDKGEKGDANEAVIKALIEARMLIARARWKHEYPHSWRSKKPVIYRNTPQWFIAMDKAIVQDGSARQGDTLRHRALAAIKTTRWVPAQGENRITGMIENRPDWVISRQRAWGVPITVFVREKKDGSIEILRDPRVNERIIEAFEKEGADAWYEVGAAARFLKPDYDPAEWQKVDDILDVWFDSGSTHAFTLEARADLKTRRKYQGGDDVVMYLEGSDQHRGWFHSSLLESSGTRGVAPYDVVLTHGFVLDETGRKMSKSLGNVTAPQDVIKQAGADILRMWVCATDYADDLRIGPEILKSTVDGYRKLRNTLKWMLGSLHYFRPGEEVARAQMPELERLMLHRLAELDAIVRTAYLEFDFKRVVASLTAFMNTDLSAFYVDVRKDVLYCDPLSSVTRKASLTMINMLCDALLKWLAPILPFTCDEAWTSYRPEGPPSVHLLGFPENLAQWRDDALAEKWRKVRLVRRVVTGALEIERAAKRIGSSLEAAPTVHISDPMLFATINAVDMAEISITSAATVANDEGPADAFRLEDVPGVAVEVRRAEGRKCARSWKILPTVGSDPDYPDVSPRDAQALREWDAFSRAAE
jgi:isoleucyl-tRNA synthetase